MRRIVAMGLIGLLLTGCAISAATPRPNQDVTRHEECDRSARSSVRGYWRQFWCGPGCGVSQGERGLGNIPVTPDQIVVFVAAIVVAIPIIATVRAVQAPQERQKEYDRLYQYCTNQPAPREEPREPTPMSPGMTFNDGGLKEAHHDRAQAGDGDRMPGPPALADSRPNG